ncbi:hypothetical protein ABFS83_08G194800 [Erythranthe nasuta]
MGSLSARNCNYWVALFHPAYIYNQLILEQPSIVNWQHDFVRVFNSRITALNFFNFFFNESFDFFKFQLLFDRDIQRFGFLTKKILIGRFLIFCFNIDYWFLLQHSFDYVVY